ncbi:hypothetical protein [Coralloluteibacterium stylophorae]|uniref:TVP38/TMEM64 family membrane protein n=1 Tax=Coralloluteibacterium stylophorae TaxID=1776034 RepID=A0A8J8AXR5_9GAMM|nr:hypothetical protein [Coralloluteibacterium stylophorae]MBS7456106.1 hypothetical protein [Coralloluteibacterium stylophorae]
MARSVHDRGTRAVPWGSVVLVAALPLAAVAGWRWAGLDLDAAQDLLRDLAPVPFFVAMAVLPALGVPITPFFIIAGMRFGVAGGLGGSAIALAANLVLCYWLAHSGLRPWLRRWLRRHQRTLPDYAGARTDAWRFALMVKLAPGVPLFAKHYLLGVARVPFPIYATCAFAISGIYGIAFVVLGESALDGDLGQALVALAAVMLLVLGLGWWRRRRERRSGT